MKTIATREKGTPCARTLINASTIVYRKSGIGLLIQFEELTEVGFGGKVLSNQPTRRPKTTTTTNHDDDHEPRRRPHRTTVNGQLSTYVSNGRVEPIVASGYIWVLLEQDKDRIVSKYTRGKIHSKTYPS